MAETENLATKKILQLIRAHIDRRRDTAKRSNAPFDINAERRRAVELYGEATRDFPDEPHETLTTGFVVFAVCLKAERLAEPRFVHIISWGNGDQTILENMTDKAAAAEARHADCLRKFTCLGVLDGEHPIFRLEDVSELIPE